MIICFIIDSFCVVWFVNIRFMLVLIGVIGLVVFVFDCVCLLVSVCSCFFWFVCVFLFSMLDVNFWLIICLFLVGVFVISVSCVIFIKVLVVVSVFVVLCNW